MPTLAPPATALLAASLPPLALFTLTGVLAHREWFSPADRALERAAVARHDPRVLRLFRVVTSAGAPWNLIKLALGAAAVLVLAGRPVPGVALGLATALGYTLYPICKSLFGARARPAATPHAETSPSFPSGHAVVSAAFGISVGLALWCDGACPLPAALALGSIAPGLVGLSRVYLGVHWASDVLGGWLLGGGLACASTAAAQLARHLLAG